MVSLAARRHGVSPNQLFHWRKLGLDGALTPTRADEGVVPSSQYKARIWPQKAISKLQQ